MICAMGQGKESHRFVMAVDTDRKALEEGMWHFPMGMAQGRSGVLRNATFPASHRAGVALWRAPLRGGTYLLPEPSQISA